MTKNNDVLDAFKFIAALSVLEFIPFPLNLFWVVI